MAAVANVLVLLDGERYAESIEEVGRGQVCPYRHGNILDEVNLGGALAHLQEIDSIVIIAAHFMQLEHVYWCRHAELVTLVHRDIKSFTQSVTNVLRA